MVKFYEQSITTGCRQGLLYLKSLLFIQDFYLAGGTALALQIGHRISTDLDWFSASHFLEKEEREQILKRLASSGRLEVTSEQDGMLFTRIFGTDVSFIYQHHALLTRTVEYENIQLASPTDIGLMKLAAINSRGTRRDFVDLYCLHEVVTLDRLLELIPEKYPDRANFLAITVRALVYFEDAETQPMPQMNNSIRWEDVKGYCEDAARRLGRRLSGL